MTSPSIRCLAVACLLAISSLGAAETVTKQFDIPADNAERTLKLLSEQSGVEVLFPSNYVRSIKTNPVEGQFTALSALNRMLAGTGLVGAEDEKTGALTVRRTDASDAPAEKPAGKPPSGAAAVTTGSTVKRDQLIALDPFEVQADSDKSYGALNANSITSFNVALDRLPVTADIFDQAFMNDVGATSVEAMVQGYDASSAGNGTVVASAFTQQPSDHNSGGALSFRGASTGIPQFNGLLLAGNGGGTNWNYTSNYDLERVEIIDGPQALLFAGGGAGGVLNLVTKEARLNQPTFGEFRFQTDQYGSKHSTMDYGASGGNFAVRVSLIDATDDSRRVNIGHQTTGAYVQLAGQFLNSIVRLTVQQSVDSVIDPSYATITSSAGDPFFKYNGDKLTYLLATGQTAGVLNGYLNWDNAQSYEGQWNADKQVSEFASIDVSSVWTKWLSTDVTASAGNFLDFEPGGGATINLYTPGASSNPLPGSWSIGMPSSSAPGGNRWRPNRNKGARATAVLTNDLFGGRAKSTTSFAADYTGRVTNLTLQAFYQADSNFNLIDNPAQTNAGRIIMPTQAWTIDNGPRLYTLFNPDVQQVTLNGVNYVREFKSQVGGVPATPANPFGITPGTSGTYQINGAWYAGYGMVNSTTWLDGKLDSLVGVRFNHQKSYIEFGNSDEQKNVDYNVGLNYHLLPWLIPFVGASDIWIAGAGGNPEPNGVFPKDSHAEGQEGGLKFNGYDGALSGSVSVYRTLTSNAQLDGGNVVSSYVDPNGLNSSLSTGTTFATTVLTEGMTAALTAAPNKNWRMRLSGAITHGDFESGVVYPQYYNDQFHENSSGQVTYADGTVVNVPATFNSKQLTVPAGTTGAVPLTVALLSTPGSPYFASPQPVTGAVLKTSPGGLVLLSAADPVHGSILTGVNALPISNYQLNPSLSGVTPIGIIPLVQPGEQTWGYPVYNVTYTSVYEFSSGALKGVKLGGTFGAQWKKLANYYYPTGFTGANFSSDTPFYLPMLTHFDLIAGYSRKFGRVVWSTQLNINNMFNKYHVVVFPDPVTGYSVLTNLNASFDQQPRTYSWTNVIRF